MTTTSVLLSIVLSLLVNEFCDVSPWIAKRLIRWAARAWTNDKELAATHAEEWLAVIEERPGKLFKLVTAGRFVVGAAGKVVPRALGRLGSPMVKTRGFLSAHRWEVSVIFAVANTLAAGGSLLFLAGDNKFIAGVDITAMVLGLVSVPVRIIARRLGRRNDALLASLNAVAMTNKTVALEILSAASDLKIEDHPSKH
jgi:hypothetical protein